MNADDSRYMVEAIRSWIPMVANGNLKGCLLLLMLLLLLLVDLLDVVCISAGFGFNFSWDRTGELVLTTTSEFMHRADLGTVFIC